MQLEGKYGHIALSSEPMVHGRAQAAHLQEALDECGSIVNRSSALKSILRDVPEAGACKEYLDDIKKTAELLKKLPGREEKESSFIPAVRRDDIERLLHLEDSCSLFAASMRDMLEYPVFYKKLVLKEHAGPALSELCKSLEKSKDLLFDDGGSIVRYAAAFCPDNLQDVWRSNPEIKPPAPFDDAAHFTERDTHMLDKKIAEASSLFPLPPTLPADIPRDEVVPTYTALLHAENKYVLYSLMGRLKGPKASLHSKNLIMKVPHPIGDLPAGGGHGDGSLDYDLVESVADRRRRSLAFLSELCKEFGLNDTQVQERIAAMEKVAADLAQTMDKGASAKNMRIN